MNIYNLFIIGQKRTKKGENFGKFDQAWTEFSSSHIYLDHIYLNNYKERNWVFATNSNLLIPISLQADGANLWYFKLILILSISINSLKYLRSTTLAYKDIKIRKPEFMAKKLLYSSDFKTASTLKCHSDLGFCFTLHQPACAFLLPWICSFNNLNFLV